MKTKIFSIVFMFLIGFCVCAKEFVVPSLTGRVVDVSNTLSNSDKTTLENACKSFENKTGGQFAICIVPTIEGETIESASMKIAEKWKIGHKGKDNGMLFLLAMKEREFRIEVGYGFEEKMNDAKAGDLGRIAVPKFQEKKWCEGIKFIIDSSGEILSGEKSLEDVKKENSTEIPTWIWILLSVIVFIIIIDVCINGENALIWCILLSSGSDRSSGGFKGGGGSFGGGGFSGKF